MPGYVAYIDQELARQVATGLIGSQVSLRKQRGTTAGINFKVIFSTSVTNDSGTTTSVENLLPEVLIDAVREAVPNDAEVLDDVRERLVGGADAFRPGSSLLLRNSVLTELGLADTSEQVLAGEECGTALLSSGSFSLRAFVREAHTAAIAQLYGEPVEALGVLRYASPYRTTGASAFNLGFRLLALWLR